MATTRELLELAQEALEALGDVGALSEYIGGGEETATAQKLGRDALAALLAAN